MNKLCDGERKCIVSALIEGNSLRAVSRMTGIARNTINKLLCDLGAVCSDYQDKAFVYLPCRRIECDEIWSFIHSNEKNARDEMKKKGASDFWTWVALCPDTKLVPTWFVGNRNVECAYHFIHDLAYRLSKRVKLTVDGHRAYLNAVEKACGAKVDCAMLIKIYGDTLEDREVNYSHVERQNLTMRMSMRRFTRPTNGFSKKVENHEYMLALHFMYYNFARIHQSLSVTPAMKAGISNHVWELEEIIGLLK